MCLNEIIQQASDFRASIAQLKQAAPYWPTIQTSETRTDQGMKISLNTKVRIFREGIWYTVHCADFHYGKSIELFKKFADMVYRVQLFYQPCGHEDVDALQISEEERLKSKEP